MAPEQEAHERAFYDRENAGTPRRQRAAADWGVNEDIFDRMPSRFARVERRAEHREIVIRQEGETATAVVERGGDEGRRFARSSETGEWTSVELVRADGTATRAASARAERTPVRDERAEASAARRDTDLDPRAAARAVMSWGADLDEAPLVPGESRTIVLSRDEDELVDDTPRARQTAEFDSLPVEPQERKTVVISGHPDRLPVPRTERRPRTAVERIGHRPDRIAGYAVALGFLLVLIAVLTTGQ
ncbi:hypothetical protein OJ997_04450 [Solirubrobacter phytolaccae]|uniref:Uncharacterized protein n=1 Tax=Solirubrobacter phytolaccae TaxID=1404360 RepID=A0A9X3N6U2_9ACTN|nr:hypothetical protein [Solirubrobacter phytolaccae]MDA0179535.1 hypothetical protein [Solirubrobacter phytolaccae]